MDDEREIDFLNGLVSLYSDYAETQFEKYRIVQDKLFESDFAHYLEMPQECLMI